MPCLTVRTKGLREFKQGLVSYSGGEYKRKLNYQQWYSNMLNYKNGIACTYVKGKYLSSVRGCKRGIAQGNSPYGLYFY